MVHGHHYFLSEVMILVCFAANERQVHGASYARVGLRKDNSSTEVEHTSKSNDLWGVIERKAQIGGRLWNHSPHGEY